MISTLACVAATDDINHNSVVIFFQVLAMKSGIISKFPAEILLVIGFCCLQQWIPLVDYALHPAEAPSLSKFLLRKSYGLTASKTLQSGCPTAPPQDMGW